MNTNDDTNSQSQNDIIVLGTASADTHGPAAGDESFGLRINPGISPD